MRSVDRPTRLVTQLNPQNKKPPGSYLRAISITTVTPSSIALRAMETRRRDAVSLLSVGERGRRCRLRLRVDVRVPGQIGRIQLSFPGKVPGLSTVLPGFGMHFGLLSTAFEPHTARECGGGMWLRWSRLWATREAP